MGGTLDTLAELAALVCAAPSATVTFADAGRREDEARFGFEALGADSVCCASAPILCDGAVVGAVEIHDRAPRTLTEPQRRGLECVAAQATLLLEARRRHAEHLEAHAMDALSRMASGLAHDLNNVLTVIECNSSILQEHATSAHDLQFFADIQHAVARAAELSQQLLFMGRGAMGRLDERLELGCLISDLEQPLREVLGERRTLELSLEPGLPAVRADAASIEQVLRQLVAFSREASAGGGTLKIRTGLRRLDAELVTHGGVLAPGTYVTIELHDGGLGLAPSSTQSRFEPFAQGARSRRGGLGLALVYSVVRQHQGGITVASTPGQGTTFVLHLRAAEEPARPSAPVSVVTAPPPVAPPKPGAETILVVEDDATIRGHVVRFLRGRGYTTVDVPSAEAALELWEHQGERIDLVLTDILMPGRSGRELALELRARRGELPILFMSGEPGSAGPGDEALVEGENFLRKPYRLRELGTLVRRTLERRG